MNSFDIFKKAQNEKYAIGSFNFSTAEILKAVVLAAEGLKSPVIVSTSEGEAKFVEMCEAAAMVEAWRKEKKLSIILNLDHGKSLESVKNALAAGYDAVHFDGSGLAYEENIEKTKEAVDFVRDKEKILGKRIIVEGELGYLRGTSSLHDEALEVKPEDLTSPEQAKEFIDRTGVDSLAVVIGNAHGVFTKSDEKLDINRLVQIKNIIGMSAFLVLHGGSGILGNDIKAAIENGIVKINVNTELRLAFKGALEKELKEQPQETTPYKVMAPSLEAVKEIVESKINLFGSAGKV